jgi:hypothetical protein
MNNPEGEKISVSFGMYVWFIVNGGADFQSRFDQFTAQETAIRRKNLNYLPSFPLAVPKSLDISTTRASERG